MSVDEVVCGCGGCYNPPLELGLTSLPKTLGVWLEVGQKMLGERDLLRPPSHFVGRFRQFVEGWARMQLRSDLIMTSEARQTKPRAIRRFAVCNSY